MAYKIKSKKVKEKKTFAVENEIPKPSENALFEIKEIKEIIIPHPYMITPKHVAIASDEFSGMLGEPAIQEAEKKWVYCDICRYRVRKGVQTEILPYSEHKKQKTLFLQMKTDEKDLNKVEGLNQYLLKIKPILSKKKIGGIAFIPKKS
jgi:hypothetical protein